MNVKALAARTIVSLDQCFLSRLAIRNKRDADFENLLHVLLTAVNDKEVVCPSHALETIYESIKINDSRNVKAVVRLQNNLSLGWAFHPFWDLVAWQMLKMVRPTFSFQRYKYELIRLPYDQALKLKRARLEQMDQRCQAVIDQTANPLVGYRKGTPFEETLAGIERGREDSMRIVLQCIAKNRDVPSPRNVVDWTVGVGRTLLKQGVTSNECDALLRKVDDGCWRQIDVLRVHSILLSKIEQGILESNRKRKLSDHPDVYRLCVSFIYSNVVTCDKPMRDVIKQTKLEKDFPVKVFAITEAAGLTNFIAGCGKS